MTRDTALTREEIAQLDSYMRQVEQDLELHARWLQASRSGSYQQFELIPDQHGLGGTTGFFDEFPIRGKGIVPVMGAIQNVFYDRIRVPPGEVAQAAQAVCRQVKEFALHYYLRVEKRSNAQSLPELNHPQAPPPLDLVTWCPQTDVPMAGFVNRQLFWKPRNGASVRRVPPEEQLTICDLQRIGPEFEWVIMHTKINDFTLTWTPGASAANWPTLAIDFPQGLTLALVPELITNLDHPEPEILGIYGPGVAFLEPPGRSIVAYGPDKIQPAFEQVQFHVYANGEIRVQIPWVTNQPSRILDIPLNPLGLTLKLANFLSGGISNRLLRLVPGARWLEDLGEEGPGFDPVMTYIDGCNALTAGWAGRELGISKHQLDQQMLFLHCVENYKTLLGTLPVWNEVPDWLDESALPAWIRTGVWTELSQ